MNKQKVGLVACSSILERRFLPALKTSEFAQPLIIGSRDKNKSRVWAEKYGIEEYGNYDDALTHPDVDWVYISTPPTEHEAQIIKAAEHGKHILCEKPAAMSFDSAKRISNICQANGVRFLEGYVYQFHPQHAYIKSKLSELGKPYMLRSQFTYPRPKEGDIRFDASLGGGVLYDSLGYTIHIGLQFFEGEPELTSLEVFIDEQSGVDQAIALMLKFPNGPVLQCLAGFGMQYRSHYEVICEKGYISPKRAYSINEDVAPEIVIETPGGDTVQKLKPAHQFLLMINAFCHHIQTGEETSFINKASFLRIHRVMNACRNALNEKLS